MADIKSYLKEKEKREQRQADYKEKIARHRLTVFYRIALVIASLAALVVIIYVQYKRHIYTDYDVVASIERQSVSGATDAKLGNAILTYSKDGAHCMNATGSVCWNQTFEIQDVLRDVSGDVVAIGEYNGRSIYVANSEKLIWEITTTQPIWNLAVSSTGCVAAILADTDLTWIHIYDGSGEHIYKGQARMDDSGYPMALGLSPNGELLCVSYLYLDAGVLKTTVAFYNFGQIGSNVSDNLISGWNYTDAVVPQVAFMNDSTAFAVGDGRLMIYSGSHKPAPLGEHLFDREVRSVFYSDKYIGLVFAADNGENRYMMKVYDTTAAEVGNYYFDLDYTEIFFEKDDFVIYNETECLIMTFEKNVKFNGNFTKPVRLMLPAQGAYKYLLVTDNSIDTIQLR